MELSRNKALIWLGAAFMIFVFLYQASLKSLYHYWTQEDFSHGFLLLLVSAYIFYTLVKEENSRLHLCPSYLWISVLAVGSLFWFASRVTYIEKLELIGLPFLLMAMLLSIVSFKNGKYFLLPIVLMLFATPVFNLGNLTLQKVTAVLSGAGLDLINVPVLVEGLLIQVPAGDFVVDSGCSGVRVLTVGASLSLIYAYMQRMSAIGAAAAVLLGMLFSFAGNIIRVMVIVYVGNETNMQHSLVDDHENLGWIVFAIMIFVYFILLNLVLPRIKATKYGRVVFISKGLESAGDSRIDNHKKAIYLVLLVCAMSIGPVMEFLVTKQGMANVGKVVLPSKVGNWVAADMLRDAWQPGYLGGKPDSSSHRLYANGVNVVNWTVYHFTKQSVGNEAININNRTYDRKRWTPVYMQEFTFREEIDSLERVEESLVRSGANDVLIWRWYGVNNTWVGTDRLAKLHNLLGVITGNPEITVYMLATRVVTTRNAARLNLQNILSHLPKNVVQ